MKKLFFFVFLIALSFNAIYAVAQTTQIDTAKVSATPAVQTQTTTAPAATTPAATTVAAPVIKTDAASTTVTCSPAGGWHKILGWSLIVAIVVFFGIVATKSNLLRVSITDPIGFMNAAHLVKRYANEHDINNVPKPFSLARSQLGIWTVVIGCSYIYLELVKYMPTTELPLDNTLLALMGISAGTAAISSVIDHSASTQEQQGPQAPSKGLFSDILSDQNGVNIHRFQNVMWTLIAVTLYLGQVPHLACGQLPSLDSTLIALTGISSATYLGLKVNENKAPVLPPPPATEADLPPTIPPDGGAPVAPLVQPVAPVVAPVAPPVVIVTPPAPVAPEVPVTQTPPVAPPTA